MALKQIGIEVKTEVSGQDDVRKLASQLDALADTLEGDLKVQAQASAKALRELGSKQDSINNFARLKKEAGDAADQLRQAQTQAQALGKAIAAAGGPTGAQAVQMQKLRDAVRQAKEQYQQSVSAVDRARASMREYGLSTTGLAEQQRRVSEQLRRTRVEVIQMTPAYTAAGQAAVRSGAQQQRAAETAATAVQKLGSQLRNVQNIAMAAVGGTFVTHLAGDVAATADEFKNLEARVKLATGEGENFERSFAGVQRVALDTNSALDETGTLFARLTKASEEGGMAAEAAQLRALGLTKTINQSIQLSGGSADSAKAAITQLIQGLQSGVLRGEEFNSVMEQAPRLAQAMANGLGVTTGKLRELAKEGKLTSEVVMQALEGQANAVATEFGKLPETVGRALQNLSSAWTLYVGQQDKGLISTENAAKLINTLAANLDTLVTTLETAGKVWAAMKIASLAGQFAKWASETVAATAATSANTVAVAANTTALKANALAAGAAAKAQGAAAVAQGAAGVAAQRANVFTTAAAGALGRLGGVAGSTTGVLTRTHGAASALGGALRVAGAGASKFVGFLGGPVGAIASTALFWNEIKQLGTWLGETAAKMAGYRDRSKEVALADAAAAEAARRVADERKRQAEEEERAKVQARERALSLTDDAKAMVAEYQKLRQEGKSTAEALAQVAERANLDSAVGAREFGAALREMKLDAEGMRTAFELALQGGDLEGFAERAKAAFGSAKEDSGLLQSALDAGLRVAIQRSGEDFDVLAGGMSKAAASAIADTDTIIAGMDRLKTQGVDVGRALQSSIGRGIETAQSQAALDALRKRVEQVRKVLGDKVADGLLEQIDEKARQATGAVGGLAGALAEMGVVSDGKLKEAASSMRALYEEVVRSGGSAREQAEAFRVMADAAIRSGDEGAIAYAKSKAATHGYTIAIDDAGKAVLRLKEATDKAGESAAGAADQFGGLADAAADAAAAASKYKGWAERNAERNANVGKLPPAGRIASNGEEMAEGVEEIGSAGHYRNRDKWTSDAKGNAIGQALPTLMSIFNQLKGFGLDDAAANQIAREFADSQGRVQYFNNAAQKKYGGEFGTLDYAVQQAAEKYLFNLAGAPSVTRTGNDTRKRVDMRIRTDRGDYEFDTDERGEKEIQRMLIDELQRGKKRSTRR